MYFSRLSAQLLRAVWRSPMIRRFLWTQGRRVVTAAVMNSAASQMKRKHKPAANRVIVPVQDADATPLENEKGTVA